MATPNFNMPMPGSREAPRFTEDPIGFDDFFNDVRELAVRANLSEVDKIKWAMRYAGSESASWRYVACQAEAVRAEAKFDDFVIQVTALYPNLNADRRHTLDELKRLTEKTRATAIMTRADLGLYYRHYNTVATYLVQKRRLSERERSEFYLNGFPLSIREAMKQRLRIKRPDVLSSEYEFEHVHEAALFHFEDGVPGSAPSPSASVFSPPVTVKQEPQEQQAVGQLIQAMADLTRVFTASAQPQSQSQSQRPPRPPTPRYRSGNEPAPGGAVSNAPQWNQPPYRNQPSFQPTPQLQLGQQNCIFCSSPDHFIGQCATAQQYLRDGRAAVNDNGKVALPDGRYPPRHIPGINLRERIDNWWKAQNIQSESQAPNPVVSTNYLAMNFLEGPDDYVFQVDVSPNPPEQHDPSPETASCNVVTSPDTTMDTDQQIEFLQAQIESLQDAQVYATQKGVDKKVKFDGVEIMRRTGPPKRDNRLPPPPPQGPYVNASGSIPTPPAQSQPAPAPPRSQPQSQLPQSALSQPNPAPNVYGRPGTRAGAVPIPRPQGPMRPVDLPSKPPTDDAKFRYQSSVENDVNPADVASRALDTKVTISTRELLAVSPDVRRHVKDIVTTKKISANLVEVLDSDNSSPSLSGVSFPVPQSPAVYVDLVKYNNGFAAATALPLRVIYPNFGHGVEPECILDGGAQVVVMRRDIWERLRVPISQSMAMSMEAANATMTTTRGLVENHPVQLGPITIRLQIQVVDEAPFEVLLGRPFFDVTSCSEISRPGGHHEIHVKDPSNNKPYVFPTYPRPHDPNRSASSTPPENQRNGPAVNFQE